MKKLIIDWFKDCILQIVSGAAIILWWVFSALLFPEIWGRLLLIGFLVIGGIYAYLDIKWRK